MCIRDRRLDESPTLRLCERCLGRHGWRYPAIVSAVRRDGDSGRWGRQEPIGATDVPKCIFSYTLGQGIPSAVAAGSNCRRGGDSRHGVGVAWVLDGIQSSTLVARDELGRVDIHASQMRASAMDSMAT